MRPGRDFKLRDAASYDGVAEDFDRFTRELMGPFADRIVAWARVEPGRHVLDVGTGTGLLALRAARAVTSTGRVVGVDLSRGMLTTARRRARSEPVPVEFRRMDAEELELPSASFDVVLSLSAVAHLPRPEDAVREMYRVLRPGGTLAVATGSGPPLSSLSGWLARSRDVADLALETLGRRRVAPRAIRAWCGRTVEETTWAANHRDRTTVLARMVREAGFERVVTRWMGRRARFVTPEDFWDLQATNETGTRKRLAQLPADEVRALRAAFVEDCGQVLARGGKLVYPYAVGVVRARRPA